MNEPHRVISSAAPPSWAEAILRMVLPPRHRESVSGDLLEEYRESVLPTRGRRSADAWYVRQTAGFVLRATWWWGVLSAVAVLVRDAFDWFAPPASFATRAELTTLIAFTLFLAAGFFTALRSRSLRAGVLAGLVTGLLSALLVMTGSLVMLAVWHEPNFLTAIERSGGLGEVCTLPLLVTIPGTVVAAIGAALARGIATLLPAR